VNSAPRFLSVDDVLTLHAIAIEDQGGDASLHDLALLDSAVATPRQQFAGHYLHEDIPAMAAAYAFHICKNHPFADEFQNRYDEAKTAMPLLLGLAKEKIEATQAGDREAHDRMTMLFVGMPTIYALAADMGYEW